MKLQWPWRSKRSPSEVIPHSDESSPATLRREIDRMFHDFLHGPCGVEEDWFPTRAPFSRDVEVNEKGDRITVRAELPGFDPGDLDISLSGSLLTISGEHREEVAADDDHPFVRRQLGSFRRSIQLPAEVDPESARADHKNGVLTLRLKKRAGGEQPRRIDVRGS